LALCARNGPVFLAFGRFFIVNAGPAHAEQLALFKNDRMFSTRVEMLNAGLTKNRMRWQALGRLPHGNSEGRDERERRGAGRGEILAKKVDLYLKLQKSFHMKTTLDIPVGLINEAMRLTGARTKRAAVLAALDDFSRRGRMREMAMRLGNSETFMTAADLETLRLQEKPE
jgi:Arc/MetJ family transcription regulator